MPPVWASSSIRVERTLTSANSAATKKPFRSTRKNATVRPCRGDIGSPPVPIGTRWTARLLSRAEPHAHREAAQARCSLLYQTKRLFEIIGRKKGNQPAHAF